METIRMLEVLGSKESSGIRDGDKPLKPFLLTAVANMFTRYMCSSWFDYSDLEFRRTVRIFDEIFWEINQGYAVDFLPWLEPFYAIHMRRLRAWATEIRAFILDRIIDGRRATLRNETAGVPRDFTDALLLHLESPETELSWDHVIFELEDFLGGHSAIGNLIMLVFANAVEHPEVQARIHAECDVVLCQRSSKTIEISDRTEMPYTEAVIWETLRVSSSPIVPHVATRDTDVDGYPVPKDTVVFINNYELNLSEDYWGPSAREFRPERFLVRSFSSDESTESWRLVRPAHFVPFSTGKRTCIGQRLVQGFTFATVTAILSNYRISSTKNDPDLRARLIPGCVAVPPDTFNLVLTPRGVGDSDKVGD